MTVRTLMLSALFLTSVAAIAQPSGGKGRRGPPPEAIEACSDKSEGDTCSFTTPRGDEEGQCRNPPNDGEGELACAPERGHRR